MHVLRTMFKFATNLSQSNKFLGSLTIVTLIVLLLPTIVSFVAQPMGAKTSEPAFVTEQLKLRNINPDTFNIVTVDDMKIMGAEAYGYVNMFTDDPTMYMQPFEAFGNDESVYMAIVFHEYGHILQKQLIAQNGGNDNSYDRYNKLIALNSTLNTDAPKLKNKFVNTVIFKGFEVNADCIATTYSVRAKNTHYVDSETGCDANQNAIARTVIENEDVTHKNVNKWLTTIEQEDELDRMKPESATK